MKRSEMIANLAKWMESKNDDPFLTSKCAAEGFLKFIEESGMLPPTIEDRNHAEIFVNKWEPEDNQ